MKSLIREDFKRYFENEVENIIEENRRLKSPKSNRDQLQVTSLALEKNINFLISHSESKIINLGSEDIPEITEEQLFYLLSNIKNDKAAGESGILTEILIVGEEKLSRS